MTKKYISFFLLLSSYYFQLESARHKKTPHKGIAPSWRVSIPESQQMTGIVLAIDDLLLQQKKTLSSLNIPEIRNLQEAHSAHSQKTRACMVKCLHVLADLLR